MPAGLKAAPENLRRSMAYFPLVGVLIAAVALAAFEGYAHFLPSRVAVFLLLVTLLLLTGGLHFDGQLLRVGGLQRPTAHGEPVFNPCRRAFCFRSHAGIKLVLVV